ncbi:carboxylesterase/lipase family protein [uncultured Sphingomonas sp.]|uniref:carboxylesterase/lipase family protein n=1 Tax=uncultured Sphingomonas sp. TaxID=158754 RepID=UPI0035CB6CB4
MRISRREAVMSLAVAAAARGLVYSGSAGAQEADPVVVCPAGAVRGRRKGALNVYTGIPYGAPTGGAARYRRSVPAPRWPGVFDATRTPRVSPQATDALFPVLSGVPSEDCLQLSVWTPTTPGPHPVFVWIHGGGNIQGSCADALFDCSVFARDGIVSVALNYRLGVLGFVELGGLLGPDYRGSANNGLLDQILALGWVKENIAAFGGNPDQITVAGESAGAFNLATLLGTPATAGLFRRAIVASGGQRVSSIAEADAFAAHVARTLGGADRLRAATPDELIAAQGKSVAGWPQAVPFRGVLDSQVLPVSPIDAVARGSARDVDLLLGWCRDETRMMVPPQVAGNPAFVPPTFKATAEQVKKARGVYAKADPSLSVADLTYKVTTAETFGITSLRLADAQVAAGGKVFKYRLDYTVENGPFGDKTPHGFDVPMVFEQFDHRLARLNGFSRADAPMGATMRAVWSSFIRTGVVDAGLPQWPTYDLRQESTMIIDRVPRVERHLELLDRVAWQGAL